MIKHPINWFHSVIYFLKWLIRVWNWCRTDVTGNWDVAQTLWRHSKRIWRNTKTTRRVRTERLVVSRRRLTNAKDRNTRVEEGHRRNTGETLSAEAFTGQLWVETDGPFPPPHKQHTSTSSFTRNLQRLTPPVVAGPPQLRVQPDSSDKRRFELTPARSHYMLLWLERIAVCTWQFCPLAGLIWMTLIMVRRTLQHVEQHCM